MSPASYRAAPPRVAVTTLPHGSQQPQNATLAPAGPAGARDADYPADGVGDAPLGDTDGEPDGAGVPVGCCACAFWYSAMASWSACNACPYFPKSPACCAALRSPSALLILSMAACTAAFPLPGGVGVVWGGGGPVPVGCCPAAVTNCLSAPGRSAANPTYCPKLTSTYLS